MSTDSRNQMTETRTQLGTDDQSGLILVSICANRRKKGSLGIEYAVLIAIVAAALIGMQVYLKRAICGRWRGAADTFGYGRQYEPEAGE